ncbi:TPA: hypothetical protein I7719_21915 [Vibrio vulnificus]|nr:hypothetical protein [Vibrio vulnificus]
MCWLFLLVSENSAYRQQFHYLNNGAINFLRYLRDIHNKAFKTDSQRMAFFIPSLGFVVKVVWLGFVVALLTT